MNQCDGHNGEEAHRQKPEAQELANTKHKKQGKKRENYDDTLLPLPVRPASAIGNRDYRIDFIVRHINAANGSPRSARLPACESSDFFSLLIRSGPLISG